MNKKKVIFYFLSLPEEYGNIEKADKALRKQSNEKLQIGYYMPQPEFKKWMPHWLISFIQESRL